MEEVPIFKEKAASTPSPLQPLSEIRISDCPRFVTGIGELDLVLGGGVVKGSAVLIGGDPGIGKSTLLLQASHRIAAGGCPALYVTGEESLEQIKLRAGRLGVHSDQLLVASETNLDAILGHLEGLKPVVAVIDSIQLIYDPSVPPAPGSLSQVRWCAGKLIHLAKTLNFSIFLVGHVTKDGVLAGPKVLEHMVDTVLYFEGEGFHNFRILRAVKNRFGPTNEIGVFEMRTEGLLGVENPSTLFLAKDSPLQSGSVIVPVLEGSRILLVEIQALTSRAAFGQPSRKVSGADPNRVNMLLAVLEKRAGLPLSLEDVFINVAGGIKVDEPAADLGIALAIASSFLDRPVSPKSIVAGEVGLGGEVRSVSQIDLRIREGLKLGFKKILVPPESGPLHPLSKGMEIIPVSTLANALQFLESRTPGHLL